MAATPPQPPLKGAIQVSTPMKQGEGIKAYISYKVTSNGISIIRRYSDFVWLQERLQANFPGYIIPPLPEKKQIGRFDPDFINVRRKYLQRFLERVATHHALCKSQDFLEFLKCTENELSAVKQRTSHSAGRGFMYFFFFFFFSK
eukprot:GSMAST32.ASY1.ANO1.1106.1 assembled CDS